MTVHACLYLHNVYVIRISSVTGDLDTTIDFSRFDPGPHSLVLTVTSTDGQTVSFDPIAFNVPGKCV